MPERPPGIPSGQGQAPVPGSPAVDLPATFGKYFLTEKLATGGMAEIYLAKLVGPGGFEKQLVIKQIHPRLSGQRHFVDLFVAEAKILVTLAHGNIVPVYELGVLDDTYFIAMEYIDGPTLYRLTETLRRRGARMAPAVAAWITARILEGLDYAHRKGDGVIHRDLSPRNVMLSRDGEVKLVDFGIAVTLGAGGEDDAGQSAPTGSFPYMSPEQVRKEPLTGQTDLFSVGVLLWEMLVGHRLFARSDPDATLRAVVDDDIATPSVENPEVPARLDEVVLRALERDATARWATAGDMLAALQRYLYSLDETPGPRDVAALVGRYCPPETRRLPTHHDELDGDGAPEITRPRARAASAAEPRPGPLTAVIPRDGSAPRGKRGVRARTETFATHVELKQMLERAPSTAGAIDGRLDREPRDADRFDGESREPRDADRDADEHREATPVRPRAARVNAEVDAAGSEPYPAATAVGSAAMPTAAAPGEAAATVDTDAAGPRDRPPLTLPGRTAPSNAALILAALGALILGGAAIVVFLRGRGAIEHPDASSRSGTPLASDGAAVPDDALLPADASPDASLLPSDASPDASAVLDAGAPPPLLPPLDARTPAPLIPRDAGAPPLIPPRDAGAPPPLIPPRDAGAPRDAAQPSGTARLTIGAIPWGDVLLDGKPIGRTPIDRLSVPAGRHVVSVTFGGEDPPRTLSYPIDLGTGETKEVVADFTRP